MSLSIPQLPLAAPSFQPLDSTLQKTALTNVRIFDGTRLLPSGTLIINPDGFIGRDPRNATIYDCHNSVLIPGFIDSHCHVNGTHSLDLLRHYGITTALDMGLFPYEQIEALKELDPSLGYPSVRGSGAAATVNGSFLSYIPAFPKDSYVYTEDDAKTFVQDRVKEGSDHIKIVLDSRPPTFEVIGPSTENLKVIAKEAKHAHKLTITHTTTSQGIGMALEARVDAITHTPLDHVFTDNTTKALIENQQFSIPTLIKMKNILGELYQSLAKDDPSYMQVQPGNPFSNANASVTAMYAAGITMLVGTDADAFPGGLPYGTSFHDEMQLLVEAGMSTVDVLRSATSLPAKYFGFKDRGTIREGLRADFLLLGGDPIQDIRATRLIQRVWIGGVPTDVKSSGYGNDEL